MPKLTVPSPTGTLTLTSEAGQITRVKWGEGGPVMTDIPELKAAAEQLAAYFAGGLSEFNLPLRVEGSDFQRQVCDAMRAIPLGETRTYGDLARDLGVPAQAVGGACGGNPIPVIIPCHRVLGATSLGGFSGGVGVDTKVWLLRHEGAAGLLI